MNQLLAPVRGKKLVTSSTPKATPRTSVKRKMQQEHLEKEGEPKKTKITKKPAKIKEDNIKKKVYENKKEAEDEGFKFHEDMLEEFISSEIDFTSTRNESLTDTMILKDYERVYEPENIPDDEDEEEEEKGDDDKMEEEQDGEMEIVKRKIEELLKMKEGYEIEIASLKSEAEDKDKISKQKEMIQQGVVNSLEGGKKVLANRVNRYKEAVPKLTEEL